MTRDGQGGTGRASTINQPSTIARYLRGFSTGSRDEWGLPQPFPAATSASQSPYFVVRTSFPIQRGNRLEMVEGLTVPMIGAAMKSIDGRSFSRCCSLQSEAMAVNHHCTAIWHPLGSWNHKLRRTEPVGTVGEPADAS